MSRIDAIKGQRCANVLTAVKPRRQTVATALATCPAGEWVSVVELFAAMRRDDLSPTIARSERGLWKLYLVDPEYGSLGYAGVQPLSGRPLPGMTQLVECADPALASLIANDRRLRTLCRPVGDRPA